MNLLNFYAGPSILSPDIVNEAIATIMKKDGVSLLEYSHRSERIQSLFAETKELIRKMMHLEPKYEVLFLHGGASMQNCMIPYNIGKGKMAQYMDTGLWAGKTIAESQIIRPTNIIASSKDSNYNYIPELNDSLSDSAYLHITSCNTVQGPQFFDFPKVDCPLIADMSSDILSRRLDFNQFDMIYAGLQKNLGTAGGCLVIINKDIVDETPSLPTMLSYDRHIKANSMLNTPPVFAVLMCNITLKWIEQQGGLDAVEAVNNQKASLLYNSIDNSELFHCYVKDGHRSKMNATFYANDIDTENRFVEFCAKNEIIGIKGHRTKGGFRASLYNSMPLSHVQRLVEVMAEFEKNN